ncbi:MAG: glutathione S-transferase [Pseudomonadota bacterium]
MSQPRPLLIIGNRNYSSWSLRPWLCLRWAGIEFEERLVSLAQPGYGKGEIAEVLEYSPTGRVPALLIGSLQVPDSLAIAEWAAEQVDPGVLWPADADLRAAARAATCEMHAGFPDLRNELPMNITRRCRARDLSAGAERDIRRVIALWIACRSRHGAGGPWLFGQRSIADAFYAPIATRFRTYGIELPPAAADYLATVLADADFGAWESAPITDRFPFIDDVFPDV